MVISIEVLHSFIFLNITYFFMLSVIETADSSKIHSGVMLYPGLIKNNSQVSDPGPDGPLVSKLFSKDSIKNTNRVSSS